MIWPGPHTAPGDTTLRARISQPEIPTCSASRSMTPSMANWAWLAPNPRKAPHTGLLVRAAIASTSIGGQGVRPRGVPGGPLQDLGAHRGVRARVTQHPHPEGGQPAVGVAPRPALDADRVALRVHQHRLGPGQRALHRPAGEVGRQRRLRLVGEVLLAPEGAAVGDQLDDDVGRVDGEHRGDLVTVVPHPLPTGVDIQPAVGRQGTANVDSGSRKACSTRWVWNISWTVWADAARAASTSPRR